jgi:hypothetical protein
LNDFIEKIPNCPVKRLGLWLALFTLSFFAVYLIDYHTGDQTELPVVDVIEKQVKRDRVFVLFIDSLRYQTATDPEMMPFLNELAKSSVTAEVETVSDAVTVPAIRAAFTGKTRFRVLGFVDNLVKRKENLPSLFSQLNSHGGKSAAFTDGSFNQFGSSITKKFPMSDSTVSAKGETKYKMQNAQGINALNFFRENLDYDFVLYHAGYMDHVAHKYSVRSPLYKELFNKGDELVRTIAQSMKPNETLIVFGDHGHTVGGRHALGLDVPTYISITGPKFKKGHNLSRIHISSFRYFMSKAMNLPISNSIEAEEYPESLVFPGNELVKRRVALPLPKADISDSAISSKADLFLIFGFSISLILFGLLYSKLRFKTYTIYAALIAFFIGWLFVLWGVELFSLRVLIHEPFYPTLHRYWAIALIGSAVFMRWWRWDRVLWSVLIIPGLLSIPTVYRYGFPTILVPVWLIFLFHLSRNLIKSKPEFKPQVILLSLAVFFLIQPYLISDASNFKFSGFMPLVKEFTSNSFAIKILLGCFSGAIIFIEHPNSAPLKRSLLVFAGFTIYWLMITLGEVSTDNWMILPVCLIALGTVRSDQIDVEKLVLRNLKILILFMVFLFFTDISLESSVLFLAIAAGFKITLHLIGKLNPILNLKSSLYALLFSLMVIATGWIGLSWTTHGFEWDFLYRVFDAKFVEANVGFFIPLILIRYCIPLIVFRMLIVDKAVFKNIRKIFFYIVLPIKVLSLVGIMIGFGLADAGSLIYLEAVQELSQILLYSVIFII